MREEKIKQLVVDLINKQLEKHGVTYDELIGAYKIADVYWYDYYTLTTQEFEEWKDWAEKEIKKRTKWSKKKIDSELGMFILTFGLKVED